MTTITTKYPFVGSIDTRQGGRSENQDSAGFVDTPLGLLLVVCDGMGGGPGGRTASLMAVDTILNVIADVSEQTLREDALKFAIDKANDIIYAKAKETPELQGMGTTVAAILLNEDSAVIAHAGDTRIYQLRKGTIVFRSSDHSVVANLVRQKKITEEEARNHPRSNIVTRALGIRPSMEIEFDEVSFFRGDRFVVCTDGIWGMMPQRDLVKVLSQVMGINELTSSVTEEIDRIGQKEGGGHDNLTLAVVDTSFDSNRKKIKKTRHENTSSDSTKNGYWSFINARTVGLFLLAVLVIVALFVFLSQHGQNKQNVRKQPHNQLKENNIKPVNQIANEKEKDSVDKDLNNTGNVVMSVSKNEVENPFLNPTIKNDKKIEISYHINNVVTNLDILKNLKGKNKNKAEGKKRKYIKNVIRPDVDILGNSVVKEKKNDVNAIIKMLNDKKTVSSDRHGKTTNDSKRHIDMIKKKVKKLED